MSAPVPPGANDRRGIIRQAAERYLSDFDTVMNVRSEARDLAVAIDRALAAADPTAGERCLCAHIPSIPGASDVSCPNCLDSPPAVAASTGTSEDVEALVAWLVEQGGSPGSSLHSWRCEYPDRYGECDCLAESARDLLASDWLAAHDAATADRVRRETAVETLREAAAEWESEYDRITRENPKAPKVRAGYRVAHRLASARADRIAREQDR